MTSNKNNLPTIKGEDSFYLSIHEVTYSLGVDIQTILDIVDEGIIPAKKNDRDEWQFDSDDLRRIRLVLRLEEDLGINAAGAGLALDLLDELERLRNRFL